MVWPLSSSLATTKEIDFSFFSSGYLDVSVPRVPLAYLWIQYTMLYLQYSGFPHSEITGSQLICNSPMLIAAYRVLRRQSVPGHPPCALISLIFSGRSYWLIRTDMPAFNGCRSVAALHTSSPTRLLPVMFVSFRSFSVSRKVSYSVLLFLCSFQGAFLSSRRSDP